LAQVAQRQQRLVEAEQLVEQAGLLLPAGDPEHAYRLFVLGNVALARRQWHRARVCFAQALCLLQAGDDLRMLAWASVNLGVAFVQLEHYQAGMAWYLRSIDLFRLIGDPVHRAVAQMNLGVVYAMTGRPAQALDQYAQAEPVFRNTADVRRRAMVYNNIGYAYGMQGQWTEAEPAYRLAVRFHGESGNIVGKVDSMDSHAQSLEALDRNDEAADVLQKALRELATLEPGDSKQHLQRMVTTHLQAMQPQAATV
jgi:tetratricopeptide (TPR) repeat protein